MKLYFILLVAINTSQPETWPDLPINGNYEYFATITDTAQKTRRYLHEVHRKDGRHAIENKINDYGLKAIYDMGSCNSLDISKITKKRRPFTNKM